MLGNGKGVGRVFKCDALDPNIIQTAGARGKNLFLDYKLHFVLRRVRIAGQADVKGQTVVLAPKGAISLT